MLSIQRNSWALKNLKSVLRSLKVLFWNQRFYLCRPRLFVCTADPHKNSQSGRSSKAKMVLREPPCPTPAMASPNESKEWVKSHMKSPHQLMQFWILCSVIWICLSQLEFWSNQIVKWMRSHGSLYIFEWRSESAPPSRDNFTNWWPQLFGYILLWISENESNQSVQVASS